MNCPAVERSKVQHLLNQRAGLGVTVQKMVDLRASRAGKELSDAHADEIDAKLANTLRRIASNFPEPQKVEEALGKIVDMRDNHIFKVGSCVSLKKQSFEL